MESKSLKIDAEKVRAMIENSIHHYYAYDPAKSNLESNLELITISEHERKIWAKEIRERSKKMADEIRKKYPCFRYWSLGKPKEAEWCIS